jgi:16S rRNA (guanine966-N2)-methyltransferase
MAKKTAQNRPPKNAHPKVTRPGHTAMGEVRIIGGDSRGRKLPVLMAEGLRPTSDRVRETLFNWLQFEVAGAHCLDLFAGSGALGFEALSRGAKSVTFVELSKPVAQQLKINLKTLNSTAAQVAQGDSLQWLDQLVEQPFDIIFLDPPFNQGLMQSIVDKLFISGTINSQQTWLYLEQEKQLDWPSLPEDWICHREKSTSQVRFGIFCRAQ